MTPNYLNRKLLHGVDWMLVLTYFLLMMIGWVNIYASVHSSEVSSIIDPHFRSGKQLIWIGVCIALDITILYIINPHLWEIISTPAYIFMLVLLVAVIFLGVEVKGSRSWFALGSVRFQPAEVSKITTSLFLAMLMSKPDFRIDKAEHFLWAALAIGLPMLIIIGESETGSTLVYMGFLLVMYRCGLSGWWLTIMALFIVLFVVTLKVSFALALGIAAAASLCYYLIVRKSFSRSRRWLGPATAIGSFVVSAALVFSTNIIFENVLKEHQRKRIEVLLGLKEDPSGIGYNVHQSMIAIGSGGFSGKGFLQGTQTTYGFVPEQSTDFIFCTIGEEWGFVGCLAVIMLYAFMIHRLMYNAERSSYKFTRIYGYCVAACIFMHLMINIGMTMGLMPVIGIPLPLVSYGGSSLAAFSVLIFIFIALLRNERKFA